MPFSCAFRTFHDGVHLQASRLAGSVCGPSDERSVAAAVATMGGVHDLVKFFRANPQALALLVVCVVLGLGTALIVIFGIVASGSTTTTGEPEGLVTLVHLVI